MNGDKIDYMDYIIKSVPIIISLVALFISIISYRYNKKKNKIEKAIELANYYQELIKEINEIIEVLRAHENIYDIITSDKIARNPNLEFSKDESQKLFEEDWATLEEFFIKDGMKENILNNIYLFHMNSIIEMNPLFALISDDEANKECNINATFIKGYYKGKINDFLNKLEAFSMTFVQGVADDDVVYQSLHQSYLSVVKFLYFRISYQNICKNESYFTNIINLYQKWSQRANDTEDKIAKANDKYKKAIDKASNATPMAKI